MDVKRINETAKGEMDGKGGATKKGYVNEKGRDVREMER